MSDAIYTINDDPEYYSIRYFDNGDPARKSFLASQWQFFSRLDPSTRQTYKIFVRSTNPANEVVVDHFLPPSSPAGRYRVETFVPGKHATTRKAIFTIIHNLRPDERGETRLEEMLALVDMEMLIDVWVSLGVFYLAPSLHADIGRVRQYDLSREDPAREISFGPVRWVPVVSNSSNGARFDAPVGTPEEREAPFPSGKVMWGSYPVWVGEWLDGNPFLTWYSYGYHTGADLNLPGVSSADKGKPVYAIGNGLVTYAGSAGSWGNIIVIEHPDASVTRPDGQVVQQPVYSRYGHVDERILVRAGQTVERGQNIGFIGLAAGNTSGWHLHFDISYTDILKKRPAHWPDMTTVNSVRGSRDSHAYESARASVMRQVVEHYLDPMRFIQDNHG